MLQLRVVTQMVATQLVGTLTLAVTQKVDTLLKAEHMFHLAMRQILTPLKPTIFHKKVM